jgi:hypothetical protein
MTRLYPYKAARAGGIAALLGAFLVSGNNTAPPMQLVEFIASVGSITAAAVMSAQVMRYMRAR